MRIISGKFKGKTLLAPKSLPVRPTTDRAKQGLFNWLNSRIDLEGISVLDLFAGIGSITFEMLSRGALHITSVDKNPDCVNFIRKNATQMNGNAIEVFNTDVMIAIERVKSSFDIVFADPPYEYKKHRDLSERILSNHLIAPGGWFIIEHPANIVMNDLPNYFETRKYGKVHFSFFSSPNKSES